MIDSSSLKVKVNKRSLIYVLLLIFSLAFSFILVTLHYFPYFGVGLFFIILSGLVFRLKKAKNLDSWLLFTAILVLSIFIFYRANPLLIFLNTIAIIYLGSVLSLLHSNFKYSFTSIWLLPFSILAQSLKTKSAYKLQLNHHLLPDQPNSGRTKDLVISIFIAILTLLIIVPLLSYSNPFFNRLISDFIAVLNLQRLIELLSKINLPLYLFRVFVFLVLSIFIPRLLTTVNQTAKNLNPNWSSLAKNLLIPKITTGIVLAVFFFTQARLYLSPEEILVQLGISHSQYAREIFAHLSIVTLVISVLIYLDRLKTKLSKLSAYLLITEAIFLNLIALKSVYDYSSNWGFTIKRLYGYTIIIWIFGILFALSLKYLKTINNSVTTKRIFFWSALILMAVNLTNFDYLIYHYAKSSTYRGTDHLYLSGLSPDAKSFRQHLSLLMLEIGNDDPVDFTKIQAAQKLIRQINYLKNKYENFDWRVLNFSEYLAYLDTKNVDTQTCQNILNSKTVLPRSSLPPFVKNRLGTPKKPANLETLATVAPSMIKVRIIDLNNALYNHNFEIKNDKKTTLTRGSLDDNSFNHIYGNGNFSIVLFHYDTSQSPTIIETPIRELFYTIYSEDQNININYSQ